MGAARLVGGTARTTDTAGAVVRVRDGKVMRIFICYEPRRRRAPCARRSSALTVKTASGILTRLDLRGGVEAVVLAYEEAA
jgi:hypothetical protein